MANFLIDYLPHVSMTNEEIAKELGYSGSNVISMWKTARTKVSLDAIWGLSKLLGVDLGYMLALYMEQYSGNNHGGVDHFPEIVKTMGRNCTEEEWEIIQIVREARNYHSLPLKGDQKSGLKKLFATPGVKEEGPLREIEFKFARSGDRRTFARRGHARDMSIDEIMDAKAAGKSTKPEGKVLSAGKRAGATA
jgi:transcriptional regulator with XRE-family HTH domain